MTPTEPPRPKRQKLDVEDVEAREERLGGLFASLSKTDSTSTKREVEIGPLPPSVALARAKAFLPLLQKSNASLLKAQRSDPTYGNLEDVQGETRVIEMDLGLGVFDINGQVEEGRVDLGPVVDMPTTSPEDMETKVGRKLEETAGKGPKNGEGVEVVSQRT
ncbi:hypothetical protein M231_04998 [Tremella mesenterica]|uniref:Uncharacterized protein n=1 Tax=Tremella mesenterica TaxID=5217 RepID=A0A4Q1BJ73_TREME|nr:hypothetical protein M231_04998 [Tremella mesenterica]